MIDELKAPIAFIIFYFKTAKLKVHPLNILSMTSKGSKFRHGAAGF